jgi:hypothetical protein
LFELRLPTPCRHLFHPRLQRQMPTFRPVTLTTDVCSCSARQTACRDPLRTRLLEESVKELASFLAELFNRSLHVDWPRTVVIKNNLYHDVVEKRDVDPADVETYRRIFSLSALSTLLEH